MALLILFAFLSGLATIVSPCVLPVLPMLLSTSVTGGRWRPLGIVLGFAGSFTVATLALAAVLQALGLPQDRLRLVAVVALGLFGLSMLIPSWGRAVERLFSPLAQRGAATGKGSGFGGGVAMGSALGLVWSPCVGPIMASVIALAVTAGVSGAGFSIALAYALGAGVPMLLVAYGARRLARDAKGFGRRSEVVRRVFGGLTVLAALLLLLGLQSSVQVLLPTQLSNALTGFEQSPGVQKELDNLQAASADKPSLPPVAAAVVTSTPVPVAQAETGQAKEQQMEQTEPVKAPVPPATATPARPQFDFPYPNIKLDDLGAAPELRGLGGWINSQPLSIAGLRGKVVIVDFWTFECYNCANTKPYVKALYDKYHNQGLEILGIHTPEFPFERVAENVKQAVKDQAIDWPVGLDPDYKTWDAYNNRYWPAFYFIDANGHIRYTHFGEGNYDYNEKVVQQLLYESKTAQ